MPKMRTRRSVAKRFSTTGSGKLKFNKKGRRHILSNKSRNRKRRLMGNFVANNANLKQLKRLLGLSITSTSE